MTKDKLILHIRDNLNNITNKIYTREDLAFAYQLGFLLSFIAGEIARDSHVYSRFLLAVDLASKRPRC